jgi:hypothetical protein
MKTAKPKTPHPWRQHMPGQFSRDEKLRSEQIALLHSRPVRK